MTKLYLVQDEEIPVFFDGILKNDEFIGETLTVGGAPFSVPSGELSVDHSSLVQDDERPDVYYPDWGADIFESLAFSPDGWEMILRGDQPVKLFALKWLESNTNSWLKRFLPNCLLKDNTGKSSSITLRVLFDEQVQEVRFDWALEGENSFSLLGIDVELPDQVTLSAILRRENGATGLNRLVLLLLGNPDITIKSDFAWTREITQETMREVLQFDPEKASDISDKIPAFEFDLTPTTTDTLVLADTYLDGTHAPVFLRKVADVIIPLDISTPESSEPFDFVIKSLDIGNWNPSFSLPQGFTFPFLYNDDGDSGLAKFAQAIEVGIPSIPPVQSLKFSFLVPITINIGSLGFSSEISFEFDCEQFAVGIDHSGGIDITTSQETLTQSFLGLDWIFKPNAEGALFTLVTKDYNYQLKMAEGAELILAFTRMSADPIRFSVTNFGVSGQGISLTAEITDDPARLNGINTLFRFSGSRLEIVDNVIQDLTLRGSGPLPPDLVGEAIVDVALQFGRDEDGNFTLISGGAKLQGSQLLACKATRFQFSVDGIGLQFVNDGGYHLYFTLTGSAEFVPAPADGKDHALAFLPGIKLDLVDCPLTGDVSVLTKHIKLLIEFPKPKKFNFLGAFEMELRAIGFIPSFEPFDGDAAMQVTGQVMFAQGKGDARDAKPDYHSLYIGLPEKGSFIPRLYFKDLPFNLNLGSAIQLNGEVGFVDDPTEKGFWGEGKLEIQGLPPISAAFAFMRVRRDEDSPWLRAWFVYVNISKLSLPLPLIKLYIREIGLGFGYRYTLVSIKAADQEQNLKDLLYTLRTLSRTQGELAQRENWAVDLEDLGQDPRWTIVLRAMMAQNSASKSPLVYNESKEKNLPNLYLLDVVASFRSDLTFYMAARGWLNTNYNDYITSPDDIAQRPIASGFILYSARRKRFLAQVASNPDGYIGDHPALPPPLKQAIQNAQVSATLLMEPGLTHFEMGWPNMLCWKQDYGPLKVEYRGGFIFRVTPDELVLGVSFLAQAHLSFQGGVSLGFIGVNVTGKADVKYGGRLIGVVGLGASDTAFMIYAALGIEVRCKITIEVWIDLFFWSDSWAFSLTLNFTAGAELGIINTSLGVRGRATLAIGVAGHDLHVSVGFKANEGVVDQVYGATQKYLTMGLEATEVEAVPGISASETPRRTPSLQVTAAPFETSTPAFHIPHYSVFVVRTENEIDDPEEAAERGVFEGYFVLLPQGQGDDLKPEVGFLPPPPPPRDDDASIEADFRLDNLLPAGAEPFQLWRFDPTQGAGGAWQAITDLTQACSWKAKWNAKVATAVQKEDNTTTDITLAQYLRGAFITDASRVPVGDPDRIGDTQSVLADERVQNPSDAAFEAAVRGAVEQFNGSPFFKRDPELEYDRILTQAFKPETSIYSPSGNGSSNNSNDADASQRQAYQMRGLILQKLIGDLQSYVGDRENFEDQVPNSVPFQMGMVFGFNGAPPEWLTDYLADEAKMPKIFQRNGVNDTAPKDEARYVRTFNIRDADFATNPPQFQNVRHYTDADTIAIAWELAWSCDLKNVPLDSRQADPEHHLMHYEVRRRALDGGEREVVYTVKSAQVLHRENNGAGDVLQRLKPRFQLVDHFGKETAEQASALPASGRSYLYTITPKDFAGQRGRPLTLVATRYPNDPPAVPVDGQLIVPYTVTLDDLQIRSALEPAALDLLTPGQICVEWSEPRQQGSNVPVQEHRLVFRRDATLPIGSYGSDSDTQRSRTASLPTGSARPLPTDIKLTLENIEREPDGRRRADLPWEELRAQGIVPRGQPPRWQPESWQVFFQTESIHGVPSALAPVNLLLEVGDGQTEPTRLRPAGLEWLPGPTYLRMLPPEDQKARPGVAHVPMPTGLVFDGTVANVSFQKHPADLRLIHFRWNQGPSADAAVDYPLDLIAGYDLLELDVDAHATDTFEDGELLAQALRLIAEVQMLPGDELVFVPNNTLNTNQWEAWYPSRILRREAAQAVSGAEKTAGSWYSWRDSLLDWPEWAGLTDGDGLRDAALHPDLQAILDQLKSDGYHADAQLTPPLQPGTLRAFMEATSKNNDPYGWAVLQHLGLSVAFSLRHQQTGDPILGAELLSTLQKALAAASLSDDLRGHLYVELLFQPGRSIAPDDGADVTPDALLATVQLGLRPAITQIWEYGKFVVEEDEETGSQEVSVTFNPSDPDAVCQLISQSDADRVPIDVPIGTTTLTVEIPATGQTNLVVRCKDVSEVTFGTDNEACTPVAPTDPLVLYFPLPEDLAGEFADVSSEYHTQWHRFKRYVEALNSIDPNVDKIVVPTQGLADDKDFADCLMWQQRFFDHSGNPEDVPQTAYLATAYPQTVSPVLASPDESSRLHYDYLLADQWAHTFRYYFNPYGRYEKLWRGIAQTLGQQQALDIPASQWLDKDAGGLDVVLERTRPVAMPVVLGNSRLDPPPTEPGSPAVPGKTWEVIVARHPEQALIERNQTLARQLAFRQIAFSLLRRFAYDQYLSRLPTYLPGWTEPEPVIIEEQPIPSAYPDQPDHLLSAEDMSAQDKITLVDLPARVGAFQQGAIALQWEALPFYYEHRLLLIAQTDSTVSGVNEITQRAFEYVTPAPRAQAVGGEDGVEVHIELKRFWDSLPLAAQEQWGSEDPGDGMPKFSALPDPDVIYQLVEIYSGNVEAQADVYFDMQQGNFTHRQIGRRFEVVEIETPTKAGDWYQLPVKVRAIPEIVPHSREPISLQVVDDKVLDAKLIAVRDVNECALVWYGNDALVLENLPGDDGFLNALGRLATAAAKPVSVSIPPGSIPPGTDAPILKNQFSILSDDNKRELTWSGPMDDEQGNYLLALPGDDFFRGGIEALIDQVQHKVTYETAPRGLDQVPSRFLFKPDGTRWEPPKAQFTQEDQGGTKVYTEFIWTGIMTDDDETELRRWAQIPEFNIAANQLIDTLDTRVISETMVPPRPEQEAVDARDPIRPYLTIEETAATWTGRWRGQEQIDALNELKALAPADDESFRAAVNELVAQLQAQTASINMDHPVTEDDNVPDPPSKFTYTKANGKYTGVTWRGAMSDVEESELRGWPNNISPQSLKDAFVRAIDRLIAQLDALNIVQPLTPFPRPKQDQLDDSIKGQLAIEPEKLSWTGRVHTDDQLHELRALTAVGDASFKAAIAAIVERLENDPITQPFSPPIPVRPTTASLPEGVKGNLLIGTAALEYKGIMPKDEAQSCIDALSQLADKKALEQLYRRTVQHGLRDDGLKIATRRGSARVSEMRAISIKNLSVS